jgi:hypothetical protein
MATDPRPEALRALADTGLRLARGTTCARLALAGLRDAVDPATLPPGCASAPSPRWSARTPRPRRRWRSRRSRRR